MNNFDLVQEMLRNYDAGTVDEHISSNDSMKSDLSYLNTGRSAVDVIATACLASHVQSVKRVLDLPCGHGRVLRHLVPLFPGAEIDACDLDRDGVDFCASTFGAKPIYSKEDLTHVQFDSQYDIIWLGSLFTHTSQDVSRRWMARLAQLLSPQGIIIATFHGRWSLHVHNNHPYTSDDCWSKILEGYLSSGYGYCDYSGADKHQYISGSYGVSLAKPHVLIRDLEALPGIRIFLYIERGWADHQDVVVIGRPSYDEPW